MSAFPSQMDSETKMDSTNWLPLFYFKLINEQVATRITQG